MSEEAVKPSEEINQEVELAPEAHENAEALSFDELDELTDGRSGEDLVETINQEKSEAEENEPEPEDESSGEKVKAKNETEEGEEEVYEEEIKRILAKQGEEDLELYANTSFKHKVDGEDIDVELQELLNNYSGKVSYDRKFQELSGDRKEFERYRKDYDQDIEQIYGVINKFKDSMENKDAVGALDHFAGFAGMKPYEFREQMIRALAPEVVRLSQMSEEQILNERLQAENDFLLQQKESEQVKSQEQQAQAELVREIKQIQEAHNITDDDFTGAYQELVDSDYEGEINAQAVAEYYVHREAFSKADEILSKVNPSFLDDDGIVESFQKVIVENPSFDDNDLLEIVNEAFGDYKESATKAVSKKVKPTKKQEPKESRSKEEYIDWDDL